MFVLKTRAFYVDEIDSRCQFHQHIMCEYFVRTLIFYVHVTRKSCQNVTFVLKIRTFNIDEIDGRSIVSFKPKFVC